MPIKREKSCDCTRLSGWVYDADENGRRKVQPANIGVGFFLRSPGFKVALKLFFNRDSLNIFGNADCQVQELASISNWLIKPSSSAKLASMLRKCTSSSARRYIIKSSR